MATFKAIPLDMISAPNYFAPLEPSSWNIVSPNTQTLWFGLQVEDSLGARRYMVATGASLTVTFQRADSFTTSQGKLTQTSQGIDKLASAHANDRSLFSFSLTSQDVGSIVGGTVKFKLIEGATETIWLQNYLITKQLTSPGF
jgi:hypothetical protein